MKFLERKQLIILSLAVLAIIGLAVFLYYPLTKQARAVKQADAAQSVAADKADVRNRRLPILQEKAEIMERKLRNYDKRIPQNRQFATLWQEIADVMNEHNLKDQLVQPGSEIEGTKLNCIPISIQCSGRLNQIFEFLKSLQQLERVIRIEQFQLLNDRDFTGWLKMSAEANVYYKAPDAKVS
jgi:Tfp pilus assembly protein PilO